MRHYSHEMHSLLRRTAGPEFSWGEQESKALEIASAAQTEIERLRDLLNDMQYIDMKARYARGEKSWANMINEREALAWPR